MKNFFFSIILFSVLVNCKQKSSEPITNSVTIENSIESLADSISVPLDSIIKSFAISNHCRVLIKAGKKDSVAHYYGFDGRMEQPITNFSQHYEIGSATKMFTASSILQLVEKDSLSLEDRLVDILPHDNWYDGLLVVDGKNYINEVKVFNLLNHTSGFADYFYDGSDEKEMELHGDPSQIFTPDDLVGFTKLNLKNSFKTNEKFQYSNLNYILLGLIIEKYSGMSYQDYIQKNILNPLGMNNTFFGSINPPQDLAAGHYDQKPVAMPYTLASSAGEIISTLDDMDIFINAWYNGTIFKNNETTELLRTKYYNEMGSGITYGLGAVSLIGLSYGHAGQTFGAQFYAGYLPNGYSFELAIDDGKASAWGPAIESSLLLQKAN